MIIETKYDIGQMVYVVHDTDQRLRMVTGIIILPNCSVQYELAPYGKVWEMELSDEKNVLMATTNH